MTRTPKSNCGGWDKFCSTSSTQTATHQLRNLLRTSMDGRSASTTCTLSWLRQHRLVCPRCITFFTSFQVRKELGICTRQSLPCRPCQVAYYVPFPLTSFSMRRRATSCRRAFKTFGWPSRPEDLSTWWSADHHVKHGASAASAFWQSRRAHAQSVLARTMRPCGACGNWSSKKFANYALAMSFYNFACYWRPVKPELANQLFWSTQLRVKNAVDNFLQAYGDSESWVSYYATHRASRFRSCRASTEVSVQNPPGSSWCARRIYIARSRASWRLAATESFCPERFRWVVLRLMRGTIRLPSNAILQHCVVRWPGRRSSVVSTRYSAAGLAMTLFTKSRWIWSSFTKWYRREGTVPTTTTSWAHVERFTVLPTLIQCTGCVSGLYMPWKKNIYNMIYDTYIYDIYLYIRYIWYIYDIYDIYHNIHIWYTIYIYICFSLPL